MLSILRLRAVLLLMCCNLLWAQRAPVPTGAVQGQVLCADTQRPARLAHIALQPLVDLQVSEAQKQQRWAAASHLITVGLDGSFLIPAVPPGLYYVIAEQDGYVSPISLFTREDLNHPNDAMLRRIARYMTPISVTSGHTTQTQVRLVRGAVIAGTAHFEDGAPLVGAPVQLLQRDAKGSWRPMRGHVAAAAIRTDDQGTYRFTGVPSGEYLVSATIQLDNITTSMVFSDVGGTSWSNGYQLTIFPGDKFRKRDAKPIKVEEGENLPGVDVDVPLSKLYSVSGTVLRPGSAAPANAAHLKLAFADGEEDLTSTEVNTNDGSFHFDFVPQGSYSLVTTGVAQVERTEVPNCDNGMCAPPTHTETKTVATFGDVTQPIVLTGDQTGVLVHAGPATKP